MALSVTSVSDKFVRIHKYRDDHLYVASYTDGGRKRIDLYTAYRPDILRIKADMEMCLPDAPICTPRVDGHPLIGVVCIATLEATSPTDFRLECCERLARHRVRLALEGHAPHYTISLDTVGVRMKRSKLEPVAKGHVLVPLTEANATRFDEFTLRHLDEYFERRLRGQRAVRTLDPLDRHFCMVASVTTYHPLRTVDGAIAGDGSE